MSQDNITIKIVRGNDIRRSRVNKKEMTFAKLKQMIISFYSTDVLNTPVLFKDDEDELCTITSTEELAEAFRITIDTKRPSLRILVGGGENALSLLNDTMTDDHSVRTYNDSFAIENSPSRVEDKDDASENSYFVVDEEKEEKEVSTPVVSTPIISAPVVVETPLVNPLVVESPIKSVELVSNEAVSKETETPLISTETPFESRKDDVPTETETSGATAEREHFLSLLGSGNILAAFSLIPQVLTVPEILQLVNEWTNRLINNVENLAEWFEFTLMSGKLSNALQAAINRVPSFEPFASSVVDFFESKMYNNLPPPSLVHSRVTCDMCGKKNIEGNRYKCYVCPDFDLCEDCYSSNPTSHHPLHPFIKMVNNDQSEVVRVTIPFQGDGTYFPEVKRENMRERGGRHHHHYHRGARRDHENGKDHSDHEEKNQKRFEKKAAKIAKKIIKETMKNVTSVLNGAFPSPPTTTSFPSPPSASSAPLSGRFIEHLSHPDHSNVESGSSFVKKWKFQNNGLTAFDGVRAVPVGGNAMNSPSFVEVQNILPGELVEVAIPLVAPSVAGKHVGYWRLVNGEGNRFGDRFWIDVNVVEERKEESKIDTSYKYAEALKKILSLNLNDDVEAWKRILEIYNGDINQSVEYFLTSK